MLSQHRRDVPQPQRHLHAHQRSTTALDVRAGALDRRPAAAHEDALDRPAAHVQVGGATMAQRVWNICSAEPDIGAGMLEEAAEPVSGHSDQRGARRRGTHEIVKQRGDMRVEHLHELVAAGFGVTEAQPDAAAGRADAHIARLHHIFAAELGDFTNAQQAVECEQQSDAGAILIVTNEVDAKQDGELPGEWRI